MQSEFRHTLSADSNPEKIKPPTTATGEPINLKDLREVLFIKKIPEWGTAWPTGWFHVSLSTEIPKAVLENLLHHEYGDISFTSTPDKNVEEVYYWAGGSISEATPARRVPTDNVSSPRLRTYHLVLAGVEKIDPPVLADAACKDDTTEAGEQSLEKT